MIRANLQLPDYDSDGRPSAEDLACHSEPLSPVLALELEGAAEALRLTSEDILLAALGRAVHRTIGEGFLTVDVARCTDSSYSVALACVGPDRMPATDMVASVHDALVGAEPHPMTRPVAGDHGTEPVAEVLFACGLPMARPARFGHALEVHAYYADGALTLDWWYDTRSFEPYTIVELAEQLPYAMIELTSEATPPVLAGAELAAAF